MPTAAQWATALADLRARRAGAPKPARRTLPRISPGQHLAACALSARAPRDPDDEHRPTAADLGLSRSF